MVSSIEADNEKRSGEPSAVPQSQFSNQLGIFDVGTGSGTQKTSWYLIENSNGDDAACLRRSDDDDDNSVPSK